MKHPPLAELAGELARADSPVCAHVKGLAGSLKSFALGGLIQQMNRPVWIIAQDRESALYTISDLETLMPELQALLFPASHRRPYQIDSIDNANVLQRAEVLTTLQTAAPGEWVIVSYPEALYEMVINRRALQNNLLKVNAGDSPGPDLILEVLESFGYKEVDFVQEPGEYSARGGIVDLFSYSNEKPYRLEFDGELVESVRLFDPATQLSEQRVNGLTVVPNLHLQLLDEERVSILDFISPETRFLFEDLYQTRAEIQKGYEKASQRYEELREETSGETRRRRPDELFLDAERFIEGVSRFSRVEYGPLHFERQPDRTLEFDATPQPLFPKQYPMLAQQLRKLQEENVSLFVLSESEKQHARLREIIDQHEPSVQFEPLLASLREGFVDKTLGFALFTDHQIFERYHKFRLKHTPQLQNPLTLRELLQLQPGDFVAHVNHGIGRFAGLEIVKLGDVEQEAAKLVFSGGDSLYVGIHALHKISKFSSKDGTDPKLSKLGSGEWAKAKSRVKKKIKELAFDLVALYARRRSQKGYSYSPDSYLQHELEAAFAYDETPDQMKAIEDVKADLETPAPMDRLVCGDVGFGKTEVAVRAAFKVAAEGRQVAVLVPTTILAMQHFRTFAERMENMPVTIEYLNRYRSRKEQTDILKRLAEGKIDVLIGTHRILSKDVQYKDVGLLIIDEEHKFGVGDKEKIRLMRENVDTLTLTATPIPRTLQFSLLGIRDMSMIATPPPNRQPVETVLQVFDPTVIRDAVAYELRRGGQVFVVHNRIKDLAETGNLIKQLVPDARIGIAHGQLSPEDMERAMMRFIEHDYDVLVSTTIIESGLDIPNANTIIILNAHMYGLSDLHQMRGRVGRSNRKAYCYLLAPSMATLPNDARKRLQAIEQFSDLGSGVQIALRDLDIRGAGDILGKEQSGFISEIGYELYQQILDDAIRELKREQGLLDEHDEAVPNEEFDCALEFDVQTLIPDKYIANVAERLQYYKRISDCRTEPQLQEIARELLDRFGRIPAPVFALLDSIRVRELAQRMGLDRIVWKEGKLRLSFGAPPDSEYWKGETFSKVLAYVGANTKTTNLKQKGDRLSMTVDGVVHLKQLLSLLREIAVESEPAEPLPEAQAAS